MRQFAAILTTLLALAIATPASAQQGDADWFASFAGLDRVVSRTWTWSPPATPPPATVTPAGEPVPATLAVFLYVFDSDDHAATGWQRLEDERERMLTSDPNAPAPEPLDLDSIGDQAAGGRGTVPLPGQPIATGFATVRNGPYVASIAVQTPDNDAASLTVDAANAFAGSRPNRTAETFNPDGTSSGGIWAMLNAIDPPVPNPRVVDLQIYPQEAAPPASTPMAPIVDVPSLPGIRFGGIRSYLNLDGVDTPALLLTTQLLAFDSDRHAGEAFATFRTALSPGRTVGEVNIDGVDAAIALVTGSRDGSSQELIVQRGRVVYVVSTLTRDASASVWGGRVIDALLDDDEASTPRCTDGGGRMYGGRFNAMYLGSDDALTRGLALVVSIDQANPNPADYPECVVE